MAAKSSSPTLDFCKLIELAPATLQALKGHYKNPADVAVIELALASHSEKPAAPVAAPKAAPKAAPPKVAAPYVQRVELYRGRARIKGGVCRDQIDNIIAGLQALKANPALLTYAECQVQFPWDKSQG